MLPARRFVSGSKDTTVKVSILSGLLRLDICLLVRRLATYSAIVEDVAEGVNE